MRLYYTLFTKSLKKNKNVYSLQCNKSVYRKNLRKYSWSNFKIHKAKLSK